MNAEKRHQKEWIQRKRKEFGNADPLIVEFLPADSHGRPPTDQSAEIAINLSYSPS